MVKAVYFIQNEEVIVENFRIADETWSRILDIDAMGGKVPVTAASSWSNR